MRYLLILIFILIPSTGSVQNIESKNVYKVATIISYSLEKHIDEKEVRDRTPFIKSIVPNLVNRYYFINSNSKDSLYTLEKKIDVIDQRVKSFSPNLVTTYGGIAFEYYLLKKVYDKQNITSLFYCIPDYLYLHFLEKYPDIKENPKGMVQKYNFIDLFTFLRSREVPLDKVILIRNKRQFDDPLTIKLKNSCEVEGIQFEFIKVDTDNELRTALRSIKSDNTVILYSLTFLTDQYGKELSDQNISNIIKKYNKKLPEVSLFRNLSRYDVGISFVSFLSSDEILNPNATCNTLFYSTFIKKLLVNNILINESKILVNADRLESLGLHKILEKTIDISNIF